MLSPRAFFQTIAKGETPSVVLFVNCKGGLWDKAIDRLKKDLLGEHWQMHYTELEGKETTISELSSRLLTTPFMATCRLVVVKEVEEFWKSLGKQKEELLEFLNSYNGKNVLVLSANSDLDLFARSRKTHPLAELTSSRGAVVTLKPKTGTELRQWVVREIQRAGLEPEPAFVDWLVEESGGNVGFIENEIEKRALSVGESEGIERSATISTFKREIGKGNLEALNVLERLLAEGQPPLYLLGIIVNLVRNSVGVYEEAKRAGSIEVGFQKARLYRHDKEVVFSLLKRHPKGRIYNLFALLQQADRRLKSSSVPPAIVLQEVVLSLLC